MPEYEYYGMMAQTWDLFRGDTSDWDDRGFYLDIIRESGQPVLDVGCGTGRLLLDYLSQGVDIDGVDISPEMLTLCRQKAESQGLKVAIYVGDMKSMRLPRQYKTILVPSSSFQLILKPEQARKAMSNFIMHLQPGGSLVMPFMKLWKEGYDNTWRQTGEKIRPGDGAIVKRWSRNWFDPDTQLEHNEDRYEVIKDGITITSEHHLRSPATREYTQRQALDLFIQAGFVDLRVYKGFTREQASEDDEIFVISGLHP
ncbi:MAG TPA: class I SAM-dependent methyltransferase [Anaerolineales bacterium]|nr:class I SAM-dependent methyltransferase [Anaerolineales bacterium]